MPRAPADTVQLTIKAIEALQPGAKRREFAVNGFTGLWLVVQPTGRKSFVAIYPRPDGSGRNAEKTLGSYPALTISDVKALFQKVRSDAARGIDAVAEARAKKVEQKKAAENTVASWASDFLAIRTARHAAGSLSRDRLVAERSSINVNILPRLGSIKLSDLTMGRVEAEYHKIAVERGPGSATEFASTLKAICERAVDADVLQKNPARKLKTTTQPRTRKATFEQLKAIWTYLDQTNADHATADAVRLLVLTGKRRSEVARLRRDQWDAANSRLVIARAETKAGRAAKSKRRSTVRGDHILPVGPMAAAIINRRFAAGGQYAFPGGTSGPIHPEALTRFVGRVCKRLNLPSLSPHDFRRTLATGAGEERVALETISRLLDHAGQSITERAYEQSARLDEVREGMVKWERLLSGVLGLDYPEDEQQEKATKSV